MKVEKYYTPEQKKAMEKKAKEEADRKARERGDNARERALQDMMGGVLEIKKEDELKKVLSLVYEPTENQKLTEFIVSFCL